jgi:hypothetical protein
MQESILTIVDNNFDFSSEESLTEFLSFVNDERISSESRRKAYSIVESVSDLHSSQLDMVVAANKKKYKVA